MVLALISHGFAVIWGWGSFGLPRNLSLHVVSDFSDFYLWPSLGFLIAWQPRYG